MAVPLALLLLRYELELKINFFKIRSVLFCSTQKAFINLISRPWTGQLQASRGDQYILILMAILVNNS